MMELERVEGRETENVEVGSVRELEGCRNKCKELEGRSKIAEERCMVMESEIEKRESEFTVLAVEKIEIEDEAKVLKRRNAELEKRISEVENGNKVDGEVVVMMEEKDEEEEVFQLMIENKVLECEKKRAESEVEDWKLKCGKLELRVLELEKENLVLRGKQGPLAGMMKTQLTNKASNPYNGSDVVTRSEHLETENQKLADNNETLLDPSRTSSTCSPLKGIGDLQAAVTPLIDQPSNQSTTQVEGRKRGFLSETEMDCGSHVRKQLMFGEEGSLSKKIAPLTPVGARPLTFGIIDISDSEDELGDTVGNETQKTCDVNLKRTLFDQSDEEDMNGYKRNAPFNSTPKRKRASNIVTTDSESDDDNVPICKFKTKRLQELNQGAIHSYLNGCSVTSAVSEEKVRESATPRRRLVALRDCKVKGLPEQNSPGNSNNSAANYHFGIPTNKGVENDEMEDDGSASDTEGESLGGFIVSSSDDSDGSIASKDVSDGNVDYGEVISRIRRNGNHKLKWEFEADMLAAFGKDPELCMKAVCALYRQQTSEEKYSKGTIYSNQRGFSQCDAFRGTTLAEFLTDGDPKGDVIKSVEELQAFDPKGPELCRTLATHYSKQLFAIYKNKEDPFFLPS